MAPGSSGPPKLDGRNYSYWKARMAGYLEALNSFAWEVTDKAIAGNIESASRPIMDFGVLNDKYD